MKFKLLSKCHLRCTLFLLALAMLGCQGATEKPEAPSAIDPSSAAADTASTGDTEPPEELDDLAPASYELNAQELLANTLPPEQLEQGWVRLFDGQSLAGWFMVGTANWQVKDGTIQVARGERSFLCTNIVLADYELKVDFRCDPKTNSGVFLRTGPQPQDVATECLELNIAPPENPFPTGSFVERQRLDPAELTGFDPTAWHTYHVRLNGDQVEVFLDDKLIMEIEDKTSSHRGHISLQFNEGRVEFRNVLLRPIASKPLKLDANWADDWTKSEKEENTFQVEAVENGLKLTGGLGQIQSQQEFGDFILKAKYSLARPDVNTGIFFRCVPGAMLDGYECQVNHATLNDDPLQPADAGAGAIFRRAPARIVVGNGTEPTYLTLFASGQQMVTWVNGLQVAEFVDSRPPHENPRQGSRNAPGPIALQGHDPTTAAIFHAMSVSELR